jgi:hypothetical protein
MVPGFSLASLISSATSLAGKVGWTTSNIGECEVSETATKSVTGS